MRLRDKLAKLVSYSSKRQKQRLRYIIVVSVVAGILQAISVASIGPFVSVVMNAEAPDGRIADLMSFMPAERSQAVVVAGVFFLCFLLAAQLVLSLRQFLAIKWQQNFTVDTSHRLLMSYLNRPFSFFSTEHSASMTRTVVYETNQVANGVVRPLILLFVSVTQVVLIFAMVVLIDPPMALAATALVGLLIGIVFFLVWPRIAFHGSRSQGANRKRLIAVQELLTGVKEIKIRGLEHVSAMHYRKIANEVSTAMAQATFLRFLPKPTIETAFVGGIVVVMIVLSNGGADMAAALPQAAFLLFAGYRILPNAQAVLEALGQIRQNEAFLDSILVELDFEPGTMHLALPNDESDRERFSDFSSVDLAAVTYRYPGASSDSLSEVSFSIVQNECIGIVGASGAGKSTLIDILLGLYLPTNGSISIDGDPLTAVTLRDWRNQVGYVSQTIYLADDTIAANISLGDDDPDREMVIRAAKLASIHETIVDLPNQYETIVGEGGGRLSGGQRQRIAIARALYRDPRVLFFDEATSALDAGTELSILSEIKELAKERTIVMVSHKLNTLSFCDRVIELESGSVSRICSPSDLAILES